MTTLATPISENLKDEIKTRIKLGIFMVLSWQLALVIYPPIHNLALMMVLATLVDLTSIGIISKICKSSSVGRDINELNIYSSTLHLIEIPIYYFTAISENYHNNAIWILYVLSIARLFYFGNNPEKSDFDKSLSAFGILSRLNKIAARVNLTYFPEILFFGSAIPLWFIIYKTSDQTITITVIALMLFIYFMADAAKAGEAIVQPETQVQKDALEVANYTIFELKTILKAVAVIAAISVLGLYASLGFYKASFFDVGYASGFNDAKSGTAPKRETDLNKAFKCIEVNRTKFPAPSDDGCPPVARK